MIHLCSICGKKISKDQQAIKFSRGTVSSDCGLSVEIDFLSSKDDIVHSHCFDSKKQGDNGYDNRFGKQNMAARSQRIQMPISRILAFEDKSISNAIEKMVEILKAMNHKPNRSDVKDFIVAYMKEANVTDPKKINEDEMYGKYFASLIVKI